MGETVIEQAIKFVEADPLLRSWLRKFKERGTQTYQQYAYEIMRYFTWLKEEKELDLSPEELINDHIKCRKSESVVDRKKHLTLLQSYIDSQFKGASDSAKNVVTSAVRSFYKSCEAPITTEVGAFGGVQKRKHEYKQFGIEEARKIIDFAPQREKTCMLMMLQGFMGVGELLNHANYRWEEIKPQLEAGKDPIKITMPGRKGGPSYWTYITTDAIHELKKYIAERGEPKPGEPIFISSKGKRLYPQQLRDAFRTAASKAGLIEYKSTWRKRAGKHKRGHRYRIQLHMFRKLAKSEASVAGRGIDQRYVEFFMGHSGGIHDLVGAGGVYDRTPELHEKVFEAEYKKITPYLNLFTGPIESEEERRIQATYDNLRLAGFSESKIEAYKKQRGETWKTAKDLIKIVRSRKWTPKETQTNGGQSVDCQKIVEESELAELLANGWHFVATLPSGKVVVSNER